jgi:peptidoglycan/xylan/chitin deacetylase (PgdA/CDA1 family)
VAGRLEPAPTVRAMTTSRTTSVAATIAALVTSFLFAAQAPGSHAAPTATEQNRPTAVPVLMYHVVADPRGDAPYPELFVNPGDFRRQMDWLARHGYRAVTLRAVWDHWHRGAPLPRRPVVVTFDDGYRSVIRSALPTMHERRWPGVLNLAVKNLHVRGGLNERQVRRLLRAGWELDAHSVSHPDLTSLGAAQLEHEVAGSRRELRRRFGVPVDFFCYPSGRYDRRVIAAVRRAGFLGATTTVEAFATPQRPFELSRVRVDRSDGVAGLAAKLTGRGS